MQALVWTNRRIFELRERPDPVVTRGDEVKIQLRIAGIAAPIYPFSGTSKVVRLR